MVATVTQNGRQFGLKYEKCHFLWTNLQRFNRKVYIVHSEIPKRYFHSRFVSLRCTKYGNVFLVLAVLIPYAL